MDAADAVALGDPGEHRQAAHHLPEHRVGAVQVGLGRVRDRRIYIFED